MVKGWFMGTRFKVGRHYLENRKRKLQGNGVSVSSVAGNMGIPVMRSDATVRCHVDKVWAFNRCDPRYMGGSPGN